jgi:hypothetical protein
MFTYKIRKNHPTVLQRISQWARPPQQQQQAPPPALIVDERGVVHTQPARSPQLHDGILFDKQKYSAWLKEVGQFFRKGDYVTLRMFPPIENRLDPPPYYIIDEIVEMRMMVKWDLQHHEPKAICLKQGPHALPGYQYACPAALRQLTKHELHLVHLHHTQNKNASGTATVEAEPEAERPDRAG